MKHPLFSPRPGQKTIRYSAVCGYQLWAREPAHYIVGQRSAPKEEPITEQALAEWRSRWDATCSDQVARLLCALERDWGGRTRAH